MNKALILDIDGVLIRDKKLLKHVKANCVKYVADKLPCCKNPRVTNDAVYKSLGHTGYGLAKALDIDTSDFDQKVYDKSLMDHLQEVISKPDFQTEMEEIYNLTTDGWNITLFTNAPPIWATPIALSIGDDVKIRCPGYYKPSANAYKDFPQNHIKIYVDDSIKNLSTVRWSPNWNLLYFGVEEHTWCKTIHSTRDICNFVKKFEEDNFLIF
jgi:FMN phosphatase YigB (HAD superfamily)